MMNVGWITIAVHTEPRYKDYYQEKYQRDKAAGKHKRSPGYAESMRRCNKRRMEYNPEGQRKYGREKARRLKAIPPDRWRFHD